MRGRWLFARESGDAIIPQSGIALPFGLAVKPNKHRILSNTQGDKVELLMKDASAPTGAKYLTRLLPSFEQIISISPEGPQPFKLRLWLVDKDTDRFRAAQIIARTHYLPQRVGGLIIGCQFADIGQEKRVRSHRKEQEGFPTWYPGWNDPPGSMIGCLVIERLTFGIPKGRADLPLKATRESGRHLAWISRIAIDHPFWNLRIGQALASAARTVAGIYRFPRADYIEIIRTVTSDRADEIIDTGRDFLIDAGYKLSVNKIRYSRPIRKFDPATGNSVPRFGREKGAPTYRKLYYWAKCQN